MVNNAAVVQFSYSVMFTSLQPHEPQHARPPCSSQTPGVHPNPCPLSQWCHPSISSSVVPFSSCPQSLPASGSFPMSQLFAWGGQSIGVSALTTVLPMNTQDCSKASILRHSAFFIVQLSHPHMTTGKTIALNRRTFVDKVMSLLFNTHSQEELAHVRCQGRRLRGATPCPRSGAMAERSYPTPKVRGRGREELPHVQGKEQQMHFAGAAMKRFPTSKVRETQVRMVGTERGHQRADRLRPESQTTSQSDHTDHRLV